MEIRKKKKKNVVVQFSKYAPIPVTAFLEISQNTWSKFGVYVYKECGHIIILRTFKLKINRIEVKNVERKWKRVKVYVQYLL